MAANSWKIFDADHGVYPDELKLGPPELGPGCAIHKRTLRGGASAGVDVVEVNNGRLSFGVLPTRGMGLWRAELGSLKLGWNSPAKGPVNPAYVPLWEPSGLGWLAGFDELMCRCGLESNGGPVHGDDGQLKYPLHGKIANTPAHTVSVSVDREAGEIVVEGIVDEARIYHPKLRLISQVRTRIDSPSLTIVDRVINLSAEPAELQLLYHTNFGQPLLDEGARVVAPAKTVVPQTPRAAEGYKTWDSYAGETPGFTEQVYFLELLADANDQTEALLRNAHGNHGVSLRFTRKQLPYFTLWKSTQATEDGYVTGLEPAINLPNDRVYEGKHGRVTKLAPHEERTYQMEIVAHGDAEAVAQAEERIRKLQGSAKPIVFDKPQPGWSVAGG
ncbi:MAG: aldose 1-epimerase family protein [Pirellulales bacterium]|nr:aldose 1-epimerase family protein [Pirellulales bacterium]